MNESMTTDTLIDRMEAAHQTFVRERVSIIREFLAGLSESEQLELIEQAGENIENRVCEALAHSPHYAVKKALMDATEHFPADVAPDDAPFFAWATIANVEQDSSDDDEREAYVALQQQAADAVDNAYLDYLIAHSDAIVNG